MKFYKEKSAFIVMLYMACIYGNAATEPMTTYGVIKEVDVKRIKGAILEKVVLYPIEQEGSVNHITRYAELVRYPQAQATILICHGFMCDKQDVTFLRHIFSKGTYNVMTFDFRAHGESTEGQCCTFGKNEKYDVIAAAHFLREHPDLKGKPVFVYGFSMGAVASIEAQAVDSALFDAMVLDCPFDSSEKTIKRCIDNMRITLLGYEFELPGKEFLQQHVFHPYVQAMIKAVLKTVSNMDTKNITTNVCPVYPQESIKRVSVPCFFIHCKKDEKVPIEAVKTIYENAGSAYKKLWLTNGRRHYDSFFYNPELYTELVNEFLVQMLSNDTTTTLQAQKIIEDNENDNV